MSCECSDKMSTPINQNLMPRSKPLHFTTRLTSLKVKVPAESTSRLGELLAVTVGFKFRPNLTAAADNVRKAFKQLQTDFARDPLGQGFVVAQTTSAALVCDSLRARFLHRLTPRISGIVVLGKDICVISRNDTEEKQHAVMTIAGRSIWGAKQDL
jgi:hypothetical protein